MRTVTAVYEGGGWADGLRRPAGASDTLGACEFALTNSAATC